MIIKYVNAPKKPDGKFGNIKMDNGDVYFVNVGCLGKYRAGMEVEPPFENKKWGTDVVKVIPPHFDPANNNTPAAPPPPAQLNPSYTQQAQAPAPRLAQSNGSSRDVQVAAIALMKSFIEGGNYGLTDLPALESACIPAARRLVEATK